MRAAKMLRTGALALWLVDWRSWACSVWGKAACWGGMGVLAAALTIKKEVVKKMEPSPSQWCVRHKAEAENKFFPLILYWCATGDKPEKWTLLCVHLWLWIWWAADDWGVLERWVLWLSYTIEANEDFSNISALTGITLGVEWLKNNDFGANGPLIK